MYCIEFISLIQVVTPNVASMLLHMKQSKLFCYLFLFMILFKCVLFACPSPLLQNLYPASHTQKLQESSS